MAGPTTRTAGRLLSATVLTSLLAGLTACAVDRRVDAVEAPAGSVLFRPVLQLVPADQTRPSATAPAPSSSARPTEPSRQGFDVDDPVAVQAAVAALDCSVRDPLHGRDDPALPLVACDQDDESIYVLGPAVLTGDEIAGVEARREENGTGFVVDVTFTDTGGKVWADFTADAVGRQVAVLVDTDVVSAPEISAAVTGGTTTISGGFSRTEAEELAERLGG